MAMREATTTTVDRGSIQVMDIIPQSQNYSGEIPLKRRHRIGRAVVDMTLGVNLTPLSAPTTDWGATPQEEIDRAIGAPLRSGEAADNLENANMQRVCSALGRAATSPVSSFKAIDNWLTVQAFNVIGKIPRFKSAEELNEAYQKRQEKHARTENDSLMSGGFKHFMRNREKYVLYGVPLALGTRAVYRYLGIDWTDLTSDQSSAKAQGSDPREVYMDGSEYQTMAYQSSMIFAGGAGQGGENGLPGAPLDEARQKGYEEGVRLEIIPVEYSAQIGPFVGQERMDISTLNGSVDMYAKAMAELEKGKPVHLVGYSEGSAVAIETANRIAAKYGGVLPDNVRLTIIGAPYAEGGVFDNPLAKAMSPMLNSMGIPTDMHLPPGTRVVYYDTDFWANSGNQVPTSALRQLIELGFGGHEMPDINQVPAHKFVDGQGVEHWVYTRDTFIVRELEKAGIDVVNTAAANRAMSLAFPLDGSEPNITAAKAELVTALRSQPDLGSKIAADFIENLPPKYTNMLQGSMDAFNDISEGGAKIAAGDLIGGWNQVKNGLNMLSATFPKQNGTHAGNSDLTHWISYSTSGIVKQRTGMDFSQQINGYIYHEQPFKVNGQPVTSNVDIPPAPSLPRVPAEPEVSVSLPPPAPTPQVSMELPAQPVNQWVPPTPTPPETNIPVSVPSPQETPAYTPEPEQPPAVYTPPTSVYEAPEPAVIEPTPLPVIEVAPPVQEPTPPPVPQPAPAAPPTPNPISNFFDKIFPHRKSGSGSLFTPDVSGPEPAVIEPASEVPSGDVISSSVSE